MAPTSFLIDQEPTYRKKRIAQCRQIAPCFILLAFLSGITFFGFSIIVIDSGKIGYVSDDFTTDPKIYFPGTHFEWPWKRNDLTFVNIKNKSFSVGNVVGKTLDRKTLQISLITIKYIPENISEFVNSLIAFNGESQFNSNIQSDIRHQIITIIGKHNSTIPWNLKNTDFDIEYGLKITNITSQRKVKNE